MRLWRLHSSKFGDFIRANWDTSFTEIRRIRNYVLVHLMSGYQTWNLGSKRMGFGPSLGTDGCPKIHVHLNGIARETLKTSFEQIWRLHSSKFGDFICGNSEDKKLCISSLYVLVPDVEPRQHTYWLWYRSWYRWLSQNTHPPEWNYA